MTDNDYNGYCNKIVNVFFLKENQNKSKEELLNLVKSIIIELSSESRKQGRNQILNYFEDKIKNLKK